MTLFVLLMFRLIGWSRTDEQSKWFLCFALVLDLLMIVAALSVLGGWINQQIANSAIPTP